LYKETLLLDFILPQRCD